MSASDRIIHSRYADGTPVFEEQEPNRLPSDSKPLPDTNATGPHSQLRWDIINNRIYQAREFDATAIQSATLTSPVPPIETATHVPTMRHPLINTCGNSTSPKSARDRVLKDKVAAVLPSIYPKNRSQNYARHYYYRPNH